MNRERAFVALTRLAANVNGWDEARTFLWIEKLEDVDQDDAAEAAIEWLIDNWTQPGSPSWAHFREAYRLARVEAPEAVPEHTPRLAQAPRQPALTQAEYLQRLKAKADSGDKDAADEYGRWQRMKRSPFVQSIGDDDLGSGVGR